ncbi:M23 family metallopeptidase [Actinotalea sp. M2MS4P-6]|uniref:M23 family metallopeptidase n=1 Tax=Actinotalea sp. M2MS4P-6 TaxID=2983762 RepID=UPI0021E49741|nr:M23 family metallopeptidase [Actinotalea sp. M2MS4P-6]MCV2395912.1 M23 family metallopeptidase [Actinotalea sp. M2MS4P-6]
MRWVPPAAGRFTDDFGPRIAPLPGASTYHRGVDIAPPIPGQTGRPVVAVSSGVVAANLFSPVRGWWVVVKHDDGSSTRYQHLAAHAAVSTGQRVVTGQRLGEMGATGVARGVHLHFETYNPGVSWVSSTSATDPEPFMAVRGVNLRTDIALVGNALWTADGLPTPEPVTTLPTPLTPEDDMPYMSPDDVKAVFSAYLGEPCSDYDAVNMAIDAQTSSWSLKDIRTKVQRRPANDYAVKTLFWNMLGRKATEDDLAERVGQPIVDIITAIKAGDEYLARAKG